MDDRIGWATPVSVHFNGKPQLIYFTGQGAVGVSPQNGKALWRYDWKTAFDINAATPIYAEGCVFISSNYGRGGALLRLQPNRDPEVVWKNLSMANHFSTSVLWQGQLYGFSNERLRCVEFATGKVKWDKVGLGDEGTLVLAEARTDKYVEKARWAALSGTCWSVPVLASGRLYLRNERKILAVDLVNTR